MKGNLSVQRPTAAVTAALLLALALTGGRAAAAAPERPVAQAARTIAVSEHASLRLIRKSGSTLYEAGTVTGTLAGTVTARLNTSVTRVTGWVRIRARGGTLTMSLNGRPRSAGVNVRFGGTMRVTGGTGRYARARGSARFSGVVNRRSWAATVDARGRLSY